MNDYAEKLKSLARLSIARQAQLTEEDFQVYLDELGGVSVDALDRACRNLARRAKPEYEPLFPPLSKILEECRRVTASDAVMDTKRMLAERTVGALDMPREEYKNFVAALKRKLSEELAKSTSRR
jgi:hypothetical protein